MDRVAIIPGGSRGIGRATAIAAAARGYRVCIGYASNEIAAREVVATIEASNGKAIAVQCDVGEEADILALFKAADAFGTLGALVNNAGIVGATSRVEDMSAERIRRMLGSPNTYVDYAASKGAIDSFTIGLGHEVAAEGIRVAAIRPGLIDTEIHASGGDPDRAHRLSSSVPMKRVGTADEIANAIVWLISDEASYVTSTILDVSGGR
jgi:NAD(P)-dependent dehydrogenase (short-subunit alcohol dehydrogenase family)